MSMKHFPRWAGSLGCAALVTVAASPAHASGPVYRVVNTGGIGVRFRNSPNFDDVRGPGPYEGAEFELLCMDPGTPVGEYANTTWNYIQWNGEEGWIPDTYTDTPIKANEFLPGVPRCGDYFNPPTPVIEEPAPPVAQQGSWTCNSPNLKTVGIWPIDGTDGHWGFTLDPTTDGRWGVSNLGALWDEMWACIPIDPSLPADGSAHDSLWAQLECHWLWGYLPDPTSPTGYLGGYWDLESVQEFDKRPDYSILPRCNWDNDF